jgi:hypothetical protein
VEEKVEKVEDVFEKVKPMRKPGATVKKLEEEIAANEATSGSALVKLKLTRKKNRVEAHRERWTDFTVDEHEKIKSPIYLANWLERVNLSKADRKHQQLYFWLHCFVWLGMILVQLVDFFVYLTSL